MNLHYHTDAGDCFWDDTGYWNGTSTTLSIGSDPDATSKPSHVYFPFASVAVSSRAVVTSAILTVNVITSRNGTTCKCKAYCNDIDTSVPPGNRTQGEALVLTTAYTSKTFADATGLVTIDITTAVQEVFDRVGWVTGNKLGVILRDDASSSGRDRLLEAIEGAGTAEAIIDIVINSGGQVI